VLAAAVSVSVGRGARGWLASDLGEGRATLRLLLASRWRYLLLPGAALTAVRLFALAATGLFWRWYETRGGTVGAAGKALAGAGFVILGAALLVLASLIHGRSGVPVAWGLGFQLCNSLGLANIFPAAMAIFGQASARKHASTAMAGFFLALFTGGLVSTALASGFATLPIVTFWLLHALCVLAGAAGLALFARRARAG
jgi:hypothetical protein